jgi:SAM-dependent methyltransferase
MAKQSGTDKAWERWGKNDPYYGVLTHPKFSKDQLSAESLEEFFASGETHLEYIRNRIRHHLYARFKPAKALDFGCGVGRILIPMAADCAAVTGTDISPSMLEEARKNCEARGISNAKLILPGEELANLDTDYDFIHSFIVFQHIPVSRGEALFESLLDRMAPGAVGVFHFTYANVNPGKARKLQPILNHIPGMPLLLNLIRGRKWDRPAMQMNNYDLNRLHLILQQRGIRKVYSDLSDHGGHLGLLLFFRMPESPKTH